MRWVCQPIALGSDERIYGVCRKQRLRPYVEGCSNRRAKIMWDIGMNPVQECRSGHGQSGQGHRIDDETVAFPPPKGEMMFTCWER